jgi:peptidoglycan hydrolase-like protein with peptidoglycan-binding domain
MSDRFFLKQLGLLTVSVGIWGTGNLALATPQTNPQLDGETEVQHNAVTNNRLGVENFLTYPTLVSQISDDLLMFGDFGSEVEDIQQRLSDLGYYYGEIDGDFGSATEAAVAAFQQDNGLTPDGVVGPATRAALEGSSNGSSDSGSDTSSPDDSYTYGSRILSQGDQGTDVSELQRRLRDVGAYDGSISGSFGSRTEEAVRLFQRRAGLTDDGIVGPATNAALTAALQDQGSDDDTDGGSSSPDTSNPETGSASNRYTVLDLQQRLQRRGFYSGTLDGLLGEETRESIIDAQDAYGVTEGDVLNPSF